MQANTDLKHNVEVENIVRKVRIHMTHLWEFTLEFMKDYAMLTFLKSRLDIFEDLFDWNYWSLCRHSEKTHSMCFADQWDHSSSA